MLVSISGSLVRGLFLPKYAGWDAGVSPKHPAEVVWIPEAYLKSDHFNRIIGALEKPFGFFNPEFGKIMGSREVEMFL